MSLLPRSGVQAISLAVLLPLLAPAIDVPRPASAQAPAGAAGAGTIEPGSGSFLAEGGPAHPDKRIRVHYHRPESLDRSSPVIMVIPGAGRNGDDYRDAWIEASERHGVLVLSPSYPERYYPEYWSYNLAGMTSRVGLELTVTVDTDPEAWRLDRMDAALDSAGATQEVIGHTAFGMLARQMVLFDRAGMITDVDVRAKGLEVNPDREDWIFADFDRIFEIAREDLQLEADGYDMFGHSAGGQILHRLVLFRPGSKARRILAANSGWYTLPETGTAFPYGLGGTPVGEEGLTRALGEERLVVFLGGEDDADETRGSLRSTPEADRQGPGRLSRGRHFFRRAKESADRLGVELGWELHVVPDVGHEHERMSRAAAAYLYGGGGD